jgi:hypothetical protein
MMVLEKNVWQHRRQKEGGCGTEVLAKKRTKGESDGWKGNTLYLLVKSKHCNELNTTSTDQFV